MEVCKYSYGGVSCLISLNDPVYDVLQIRSQKLFQFMFCSRFLFYWETRSQCVAWIFHPCWLKYESKIEFATFDINFIICTLTPYILKVVDFGVRTLQIIYIFCKVFGFQLCRMKKGQQNQKHYIKP